MAINRYEKAKLAKAIEEKLAARKFTFGDVQIHESKTGKLTFTFTDVRHPEYSNIRILSHDSLVKETTLSTRARISLRFLHGNRESPVIGMKIVTFNTTLA
jgi:hypothetical protein